MLGSLVSPVPSVPHPGGIRDALSVPHRIRAWSAAIAVALTSVLLAPTASAAPATVPAGPPFRPVTGPATVEVPILRPSEGYPRIYVQTVMPDGELGLFLVDTGADISVLSRATAERLGLHVEERQFAISGLSGSTWVGRSTIPSLGLGPEGEQVVHDIDVAVGVRGMGDEVGFLPLDGLLGNNVWQHFVLEIDYPKNTLVLHEPDGVRRTRRPIPDVWRVDKPARVAPMHFDGGHTYSPITLTTSGDAPVTATVITQVDTGAGGLKLCAATGAPFSEDVTEGLESIRGIGASETLPPHRFLEMTRRIPLESVILGGRRFDVHTSAQWLDYDKLDRDECAAGMRALLGHEFLGRHRVIFDYGNHRMALLKSRGKPVPVNGHAVVLAQDLEKHGEHVPDRALFRAKLNIGAGNDEQAIALLQDLPATLPPEEQGEARVLLARLQRFNGNLDAAWAAIAPLGPAQLVDAEEIVGTVNGLLFEERADEAMELAEAAVAERPESGDAWVARADVRLFLGDTDGATEDLLEAARLEEYPDAHLLRRARVALARGDRYGAMAHVRKLLRLYPFGGEFLWFYAMLVETEPDAATFRADMDQAMSRLHPDTRPVDFRVAALHTVGDDERAQELMHQGIDELCNNAPEGSPDHDNCVAWFWSLAGVRGDESLRRIERALAETGERSDYLDTKAVVHLARGEFDAAAEAAWAAARLSPADVYMLWQAERIRDLRDRNRHALATPTTESP